MTGGSHIAPHDPRTPGALAERWAVALLRLPGGTHTFSVSLRDIEADTAWACRVFERMGLQRGLPAHLIGAGFDYAILWPYENALIGLGVPFGVAEPVTIDAPRTDMLLRRLRMQAVIGLTGEIVAALLALGRDLPSLLGHSTLATLPDATGVLREAGLRPWTVLPLGPLWAFEPPEGGGADYDRSEWLVETIDGELVVSSMAARATPWRQLRTAVRGRIAADGRVLCES
jgi:hypothetical protein